MMSADNFFSWLKVGDKIDFFDEEYAHWKVAVIKDIRIHQNECNIHLSFNRVISSSCRTTCNKWIYLNSQSKYYKTIQPLNTHALHHDPNSTSCFYELAGKLDVKRGSKICTKCKRVCCSSCFVIRISDNSSISKTSIFCKDCSQMCHRNETCHNIYGAKCSTCQLTYCTKCSSIYIYNRSNGHLTSRECYQCYSLKQYEWILIITQSMLRRSCTTNADINVLKLITDFVHNTTLRCEYGHCSKHEILTRSKRDVSISLSDAIYIDIDGDHVFICNVHTWSGNTNKLSCTTIRNCHFSDNITSCGHCQSESRKICIECDRIIKCRDCGKVCHGDSECNYQDYIVDKKQGFHNYKVLLSQCKDCYSVKLYKYQFNITRLICKSMFVQTRKVEFERNIIELISRYYVEDLWKQFLVLPVSPLQLKNGCYRIDNETGYPGKVTEFKTCKCGKHGHKKYYYKLFIPYTGQILSKMHTRFSRMLMTCHMKTDEYIFNRYVDDGEKLVECKNQKTGEYINIVISPFDKYYATVTGLIEEKGENDKLILYVLNGPKYSSERLELMQCIVDAKIEQDVYDVMD
eukprot:369442_1